MTVTHPAVDVPKTSYDHVYLHAEELADLLGIEGVVLSVWTDPESRFVHMMTVGESENSVSVERGGYVDVRHYTRSREKL